jgi:hypothetical protein
MRARHGLPFVMELLQGATPAVASGKLSDVSLSIQSCDGRARSIYGGFGRIYDFEAEFLYDRVGEHFTRYAFDLSAGSEGRGLGEVDPEDARENELSLKHGWRLLSAYTLGTGIKVRVITEPDRSST